MADRSEKLAIIVTAQDLASGKLGKVRSELASMGTSGKIASVGIGAGMLAVNKGEQALGNFKNRLTSLAAPLAMIGVTGGLFSIAGALEQGVTKAQAMGLATEKVTGATGLSAHAASQAVAVFDKYGLSGDQAATMLGRLEKNAFTAANTQKLATKFQTEYGLSLVDSSGKVKDTTALLGTLSDYYVKNGNTAQTDAAMAKLLGKNWMDLIPILKEGSKGYADAAAQADAMGTTLQSALDVKSVDQFIADQRLAGQAVSGLETQLGLLVMPDLSKALEGGVSFLTTHKDDVKAFFASGLQTAEQLGGFITGTVVPAITSVAGAASKVWGMIPGPMQDLLVKGFVADRTLKFFFGMSPIHAVVSLAEGAVQKGLGSLVSGIFTKGATPANPMFVADVTGGAAGAAEGAGAAEVTGLLGGGMLSTIAGVVIPAAAVFALAYFADDIQKFLGDNYTPNSTLPADQLSWPWGPKNTPHLDIGPFKNILGGDSSFTSSPSGPSSSGGTGGFVGQDQYAPQTSTMAQSKQLAADMRQGFMPTLSQINAELKTNRQIVQGQAAANARARSDEHRDLASMGSTTMKSAFMIVAAIQAMQAAVAGAFILNSPSLTKSPTVSPRDNVTNNRLLMRNGGGRTVSPI